MRRRRARRGVFAGRPSQVHKPRDAEAIKTRCQQPTVCFINEFLQPIIIASVTHGQNRKSPKSPFLSFDDVIVVLKCFKNLPLG